MLMGIVTKNAIMLVDFAVEAMHRGLDKHGGHHRGVETLPADHHHHGRNDRGHGAERFGDRRGRGFSSPMAIAVIGGLVVATLLSPLFVPAFFTIMDDCRPTFWAGVWTLRWPGRRTGDRQKARQG